MNNLDNYVKRCVRINEIFMQLATVTFDSELYLEYIDNVIFDIDNSEIEELENIIVNGPVWDGDIINSAARNFLLDIGLVVRIAYKGKEGYTAATYNGLRIYKRILKGN